MQRPIWDNFIFVFASWDDFRRILGASWEHLGLFRVNMSEVGPTWSEIVSKKVPRSGVVLTQNETKNDCKNISFFGPRFFGLQNNPENSKIAIDWTKIISITISKY